MVGGAARIVTTSLEMAHRMSELYPRTPLDRYEVIPNSYGEAAPDPTPLREPRPHFTITYTGSLAYGRLDQALSLIEAVRDVRSNDADIRLGFAGSHGSELRAAVQRFGATAFVTVRDWVSPEEAAELQGRADALLLLQPRKSDLTNVALPGKLFDYMALRTPVLALAGGASKRVIDEHALGVVADEDTASGIASALLALMETVRRTPTLPPPPEQYSEQHTMGRFVELIRDVAAGSGGGPP